MGTMLFGVDISGEVARELGPGLPQCTLIRTISTSREPGNLAGGLQPTTIEYTCRGVETDLEQKHIDGSLVKQTDVAILLLGDTIDGGNVQPQIGDRVTSDGRTRAILRILERDPAKATFLVAVRGP